MTKNSNATPRALTPEQVKRKLAQEGITTTEWAASHGYSRNAVYRVLNGTDKALYGKSHEIAVKLGLKPNSDCLSSNEELPPPDFSELVANDLKVIGEFKSNKYSSRKALQDEQSDAYQQALKLVLYLRKSLFERDGK